MPEPVIRVRDLEKRYRVWAHAPPTNLKERVLLGAASLRARAHLGEREQFRRDVWALRGVSFDVGKGEVLGVIGHNGAGKSTLLAILSRITEPTAGRAEILGRVSSLLEVGTGFHPELSGRDNVFLNGAILGMSRGETRRKFDEIVEFSGMKEFIDLPVKRYSSGMQVRLAFSVAAHLDPEVLLLDEVLAVGDASFQAKCHARVEEIAAGGRTVLFVSHDVSSVVRLCENAVVLDHGLISFHGAADDAAERYMRGTMSPSGGGGDREVGPVGIRTVEARTSAGAVLAGEPFELAVELDSREPVPFSELRLELGITDGSGAQYAVMATDLLGGDALVAERLFGRAILVCHVEGVPLKPGAYFIAARLYRHGDLVDRLDRAAEFTVVVGSFFGSRGVPSSYHAPLLVRHGWSFEQGASYNDAAAGVAANGVSP